MANKAVKAAHRERMIEVKVRFHTNGFDERRGYILPKHALTSGKVQMDRNGSHGIVPLNPQPFNSLMEIPAAIEKTLMQQDIKLHRAKKMLRYLE